MPAWAAKSDGRPATATAYCCLQLPDVWGGCTQPRLHCCGLQADIADVLALAPGDGRHALVVKLWRKDSQVLPVCHCN